MPVKATTTHDAICDECPWIEGPFREEAQALDALDEHIRQSH